MPKRKATRKRGTAHQHAFRALPKANPLSRQTTWQCTSCPAEKITRRGR